MTGIDWQKKIMMHTIDLILRSASLGICAIVIAHFISIRPLSRKTVSALVMVATAVAIIGASSMAYLQMMQTVEQLHLIKTIVFALSPPLLAWGILEIFEDSLKSDPGKLCLLQSQFPLIS